MWDLGDDQKTWKTDMSVATLELVMHPNRTTYVAPAPAPAPEPVPEPVMVDKNFSLSSDVLFAFGKSTGTLKPEGLLRSTPCISRSSTSSRKMAAPWWWLHRPHRLRCLQPEAV